MRKSTFLLSALLFSLLFLFSLKNSNAVTYTVTVQNTFFSPSNVDAYVGDTIKFQWVNGSHTTTCDAALLPGTSHPAGAADWDANINSGSQTFIYILKRAGAYTYGCQPHWPGMQATINASIGYKYWSGAGDGTSWSDAANWLDGTAPLATDSVKLDNSQVAATYTVTLPSGLVNTQVANIKIYPTLPNFIYLTLPVTNTSTSSALLLGDGLGSPYDLSISKHGVFNYQTGAASGTPFAMVNSADSIQLLDSGMWNHNCAVGQTGIANKLSKRSDTRKGIFKYDMKTTSFASIQFQNITYGTVILSGAASGAPFPGKKYITTGSSACNVRGDFYMDALCYDSSTMTNNLNIAGDCYFYGKTVYAPVATPRTLNLNGTTLQNIYCSGVGSFISGKVIFNNAGGFNINNPFSMDSLTMTNGNIATAPGAYLGIGYSTANSGFLNRTGGIVTGVMSRWFLAGATTSAIDFPVGNSTTLKRGTVAFSSAPTTEGRISMSYNNVDNNGTDLPITLNDAGYSVTKRSNSNWVLSDSLVTGGLVDVSFDGNGQTGIVTPAALRVIWSSNGSAFSLQGTHVAGSGTIGSRSGIATYNKNFYLAGNNTDNPMPVELKDFVATTIKNDVILDWTTGHEVNNNMFEIERASLQPDQDHNSTGLSFAKVGSVAGNGSSNIVNNYKFTDKNLTAGRFAYRLKQIDNNGDHTYYLLSNEVIVNLPSKFTVSQNYPNPFNPVTNINYEMPFAGKVNLTVFDGLGREVKTLVNGNIAAGYYKVEFNASSLPSGIYFYRVNGNSRTETFSKVFKMMLIK